MFQQLKNGEKLQPLVEEVEQQIAKVHKEIDQQNRNQSISGLKKLSKTSCQ